MQPSLQPGHCWAFAGSSGRLTVRLSTPVVVSAVTIDHSPAATALVRRAPRQGTAAGLQQATAPREFVVFGYYPAPQQELQAPEAGNTNATATAAAGGRAEEAAALLQPSRFQRVLLGSFAYDALGPPTQTFLLPPGAPATPAEYVTLEVASNHGHPDYTCLYRFRVHGAA